MSGGGTEREGDTESEAGSALSAQSPTWGLNSRTTRLWPELKLDLIQLSPPGTPPEDLLKLVITSSYLQSFWCIWHVAWALRVLKAPQTIVMCSHVWGQLCYWHLIYYLIIKEWTNKWEANREITKAITSLKNLELPQSPSGSKDKSRNGGVVGQGSCYCVLFGMSVWNLLGSFLGVIWNCPWRREQGETGKRQTTPDW